MKLRKLGRERARADSIDCALYLRHDVRDSLLCGAGVSGIYTTAVGREYRRVKLVILDSFKRIHYIKSLERDGQCKCCGLAGPGNQSGVGYEGVEDERKEKKRNHQGFKAADFTTLKPFCQPTTLIPPTQQRSQNQIYCTKHNNKLQNGSRLLKMGQARAV